MKIKITLLVFFMTLYINAQTWTDVGGGVSTAGQIYYQSMELDNNDVPYVAYQDIQNSNKITVKKFNGTSWVTVGAQGFTNGLSLHLSLVFDNNNVPYVAYSDFINSRKTTVKKFNGTTWVTVGASNFSSGAAEYQSLAFDSNNVPYVAYSDGYFNNDNKTTVKKFNGTSWVTVGNEAFSQGEAYQQSLVLDSNDIPYVAYQDRANADKSTVMKFNGTAWVDVGAVGFSVGSVSSVNLALDNNDVLYIAYGDGRATVQKFNGTSWVPVGNTNFSPNSARGQSLVFDSGNVPYVAYSDDGSSGKTTVKKLNGTNWVTVGMLGFSTGFATQQNLVLANNDDLYVSYIDNGSNYQVKVKKFSFSTTWIGSNSNSWNIASNWSNGVPTGTVNAVIPNTANSPIIRTVSMFVKNLEVQTGATLGIDAGKTLTIEGNLVQEGTFNIAGDVSLSNQGSLILKGTYSGAGNVNYNREVTTNFHLLTSPVVGQSIAAIKNDVAVSGLKYAIAPYNNTLGANRYNYYTTVGGTNDINIAGNFLKGKGYSIQKATAGILSFSGALNTSDVPMAITDGSATGNKWNLVGNPFTSSIQANSNAHATDNFLTVNAAVLDPARVAIYVWNVSTGSYDIINQTTASKHIASSQGFFVESINGGGTLQFTEVMQNHQGNSGSSSRTSNTIPSIELMVSNGASQKSTAIKYFSTATTGLDAGYDAGIFSGESQVFNVFTQLVSNDNTTAFGIQSLPTSNYDAMVIPVGVNAIANTTLSFSVASENLPTGINVYLEDRLTNTFTKLNTAQENFRTTIDSAVNGVGRFYIHTSSSVLGINDDIAALKSVSIYKSAKTTLTITGLINEGKNTVKIFNILGKEVLSTSFEAQQKATVQLPVNISKGVYIVKLETVKGNVNKKIILN